MSTPRVSICVPTFNGEAYLHECLESVCNQTFTDIEILIVDDGSTDNTLTIAETFQRRDMRIVIHRNARNLGLTGNWNRCIELANGEWIKFVFQDDAITTDCLEMFLSHATNDTQLMVCEREFVFEDDVNDDLIALYQRIERLYHFVPASQATTLSAERVCRLAARLLPANFIGEPTSLLFRKSCTVRLGAFDDMYVQLMDLEFALRIGMHHGFVYVPQKLARFRVHAKATTHFNNTQKYFASIFGDQILVINALLHSPRYELFRQYNRALSLMRMQLYLHRTVYRALRYISRNHHPQILIAQFEALKNTLPNLDRFAKHRLPFWCLDALGAARRRLLIALRGLVAAKTNVKRVAT